MLEPKLLKTRYSLETYIKEGTDAIVYKGMDIDEDREVAVKILKSGNLELTDVNKALSQFQKEIEFLHSLRQPYFPNYYELFYERGNYYLVMEWIEGESLAGRVKRKKYLDQAEALRIMYKIAEFLAYVEDWDEGEIYKEIKPSNIIIDQKDCLKIVDFGTARIFSTSQETRQSPGTPGYVPPEAYEKSGMDKSAEVYSLGATIYFLVTGKDPIEFGEKFPDPREINPGLTEEFANLILECLKPKGKRIPDARTLLRRVSKIYFKVPPLIWGLVIIPLMFGLSVLLKDTFLQIFPTFLTTFFKTTAFAGSTGCFVSFLATGAVFGITWLTLARASERAPRLYSLFFAGVFATVFYLLALAFLNNLHDGNLNRCCENCSDIGTALKKYSYDYRGEYPGNLAELMPKYIKSIPTCPEARADTYSVSYERSEDRKTFTIYCKGLNHNKYVSIRMPENWPRFTSNGGLLDKPDDRRLKK